MLYRSHYSTKCDLCLYSIPAFSYHVDMRRAKSIVIIEPEELQALLDACSDTLTGTRNKAIIMVLARTGMRVSALTELTDLDINLRTNRVQVHLKGGGYGHIKLFDTDIYLHKWLEEREQLNLPQGSPLFCCITAGKIGKKITRFYIAQMLTRIREHAGIARRIHAHAFRHTLSCTLAMNHKVPTVAIRDQLCHTRIQTTERYLEGLGAGNSLNLLDDIDVG